MAQYVFSMNRVTKTVPPKRQILKDISLSFFPGAKIGVLGLNGSGKSSLLKIMAGKDGGDGLGLDGGGVVVPLFVHGLQNGRRQLQFFECHYSGWMRPSWALGIDLLPGDRVGRRPVL